ncbi:MAG: YeeE/YedE thiosulfate transporter family protein [Clostridia bacterium]
MSYLKEVTWSPYVVGFLIGILNIVTLIVSKKFLGASTSYLKTSGMIAKMFNKEKVESNEYYQIKTPKIDWGWMLLIGIVIGSFISSRLSGSFQFILIPQLWRDFVSDSLFTRVLLGLLGGTVMGFGARLGGGCTSGHGISGAAQLSVVSWIASICFFIGGILSAGLIFGF